jgi:hypothetical protein
MPSIGPSVILAGFNIHITSLLIILFLIFPTVVVLPLPLPLPASILLLQFSMQVHLCNAFSILAWLFASLCKMCRPVP